MAILTVPALQTMYKVRHGSYIDSFCSRPARYGQEGFTETKNYLADCLLRYLPSNERERKLYTAILVSETLYALRQVGLHHDPEEYWQSICDPEKEFYLTDRLVLKFHLYPSGEVEEIDYFFDGTQQGTVHHFLHGIRGSLDSSEDAGLEYFLILLCSEVDRICEEG